MWRGRPACACKLFDRLRYACCAPSKVHNLGYISIIALMRKNFLRNDSDSGSPCAEHASAECAAVVVLLGVAFQDCSQLFPVSPWKVE